MRPSTPSDPCKPALPPAGGTLAASLAGLAALLMWGSLIAVARSVVEQMGVLASAAAINLIGGAMGAALAAARRTTGPAPRAAPRKYLLGCGALFVLYNVALYLAIQRAAGRTQVVEVGLVNYLWPALTLTLAVPILGQKARPTLLPGLAVALAGIYLGTSAGGGISIASIRGHLADNPVPYALALVAACSWALYSNLARRWAAGADRGRVHLFLLATGIVLAAAAWAGEPRIHPAWTARGAAELLYLALFPTLLAYVFWDLAMRRGHLVLVSSASFLTPLISTLISCCYLRVPMGRQLWAACALVILGAVVCRYSVIEKNESRPA